MNKQEWVGTQSISGNRQQMIKVAAMWNLRGVTAGSWCHPPLAERTGRGLMMRGLDLGINLKALSWEQQKSSEDLSSGVTQSNLRPY